MRLKFNKRIWWHFGNKCISLEVAGLNSNPSIYIRVDGDEREVTFHLAFFIGIWISFDRFIPDSLYPTYESSYGHGRLPEERELSISWHNGSLWWNFWVSEEWSSWTKNKTWRKGCFRVVDMIMGKHVCKRIEVDRREFLLPFLEGNYNVEVIQYARTDSWKRWPTKNSTSWEVKPGYYEGESFIEKPIPKEGKGENSWDCDEDATYAMSFPGPPYRKELRTSYDAALYFWHSMMKDRERYGSSKWVPEKFKKNQISFIK